MDAEERETHLAQTFAEVARQLQAADSREETWQRVVDLAVDVLPPAEYAAISLVYPGGVIETPAASGDPARAVDAIQYEETEGPCLSAIHDEGCYLTGDLAQESRWPRFAERTIAETGIRSMLSFKLFVEDDCLGALNLYSEQRNAFDERSQAVGEALAAHAAIAMSAADEHQNAQNLHEALASSREIGIAIGIVMVQSRIDRSQAFRVLSGASQRMNVKLRSIAERIVERAEVDAKQPRLAEAQSSPARGT